MYPASWLLTSIDPSWCSLKFHSIVDHDRSLGSQQYDLNVRGVACCFAAFIMMTVRAKNDDSAGAVQMHSSRLRQDVLLQGGLLAMDMASGLESGEGVRSAAGIPSMLEDPRHQQLLGIAVGW